MAVENSGESVACGSFDGGIRIIAPHSGNVKTNIKCKERLHESPVSSLRWMPVSSGRSSYILTAIRSNGVIEHYNTRTNMIMHQENNHKEMETSLYCGEYTNDASKLIVAGEDKNVYVYDT